MKPLQYCFRVLPVIASALLLAKVAVANDESVTFKYGSHGLEVQSAVGNYDAWFGLRAQLRATYPFADDPRSASDFDAVDETTLAINRARLKSGGHIYDPRLDYYVEYELVDSQLLDLRFTFKVRDELEVRIGQWKAEYNRERRDSSGEQQFVERSIVNRTFTLDRQSGLMLSGRLWAGQALDSHYWVGLLSGEGLGEYGNAGTPLYMARWQWNFTRHELAFSQSDIERKVKPHGSFALAAAKNRSRWTRFSSAGGGELDGLPADSAERYDIEQIVAEAAFQQRGLSLQAEWHQKSVRDRTTQISNSRYTGGYLQVGYFFSELWSTIPRPLELAARIARVDSTDAPLGNAQSETTLAANWFFAGHRNKLTADTSYLKVIEPSASDSGMRVRVQWDVSF